MDLIVQPVDLLVSLSEFVPSVLQLLVQVGRGEGGSLFFLSATDRRRRERERGDEENELELGAEKLDLFVQSAFVPVGLFGLRSLEEKLLLQVRLLVDEDLVGRFQLFDGAVEVVDALLLVGVLAELIFEQVELLFELLGVFVQLDVLQEVFVVSLLQHHDQPGLVVDATSHLAQLRLLFRRDAAQTRDDGVGLLVVVTPHPHPHPHLSVRRPSVLSGRRIFGRERREREKRGQSESCEWGRKCCKGWRDEEMVSMNRRRCEGRGRDERRRHERCLRRKRRICSCRERGE